MSSFSLALFYPESGLSFQYMRIFLANVIFYAMHTELPKEGEFKRAVGPDPGGPRSAGGSCPCRSTPRTPWTS